MATSPFAPHSSPEGPFHKLCPNWFSFHRYLALRDQSPLGFHVRPEVPLYGPFALSFIAALRGQYLSNGHGPLWPRVRCDAPVLRPFVASRPLRHPHDALKGPSWSDTPLVFIAAPRG
jgi:hypothetical protein